MLGRFWINGKVKGVLNRRMYKAIFRIAEAQAKLQLRDKVDEDIAYQVQNSIWRMASQYGEDIAKVKSLNEITYQKFLEILQNSNIGMAIASMCEMACDESEQIADYLGPKSKWYIEHNFRLKNIINSLRNNSEIREVRAKPIVLQWIGTASDAVSLKSVDNRGSLSGKKDAGDGNSQEIRSESGSSDTSDTSDRNENYGLGPPLLETCPTCGDKIKAFYMKNHRCDSASSQPDISTIFRKYPGSDIWACHKCKLTADKWFMQKHPCRGRESK